MKYESWSWSGKMHAIEPLEQYFVPQNEPVLRFFSEGCVKGNVWMCLKIQHFSIQMAILGRLD
jgi:hypothetical protein